jgi:hypothetical protein
VGLSFCTGYSQGTFLTAACSSGNSLGQACYAMCASAKTGKKKFFSITGV